MYKSFCMVFIYCFRLLLMFSLSLYARAEVLSWQHHDSHSFRVIAGSYKPESQTISGAFEFSLHKGWTTYWQYPGDAGLPLTINQYTSDNIVDWHLFWPAPQRFIYDHDIYSLGYKDKLMIPFSFKIIDNTKPISLAVGGYYGVCKNICIPFTFTETLQLNPGDIDAYVDKVLAQALAGQPEKLSAGAINLQFFKDRQRIFMVFDHSQLGKIHDVMVNGRIAGVDYKLGIPEIKQPDSQTGNHNQTRVSISYQHLPDAVKLKDLLAEMLILASTGAYVVNSE